MEYTPKKRTYILLQLSPRAFPEWWIKEGSRAVNCNGAGFELEGVHKILKTQDACTPDELDHSETALCNPDPDTKTGWLAPDARFYPCLYADHDRYARIVLHAVEGVLETTWVRIVSYGGKLHAAGNMRPSPEQIGWMRENGVSFENCELVTAVPEPLL